MRFSFFLITLIVMAQTATAQLNTAENGLSSSGLDAVHLGGSLIKTTYINTNLNNFHFDKASGPLFSVLNNGNIGIGTYTPAARLSFLDVHLTEDPIGMTWYNGGYGGAPTDYGIHRTAGPWAAPNYAQLRLGWLTGIILDPGVSHGKSYVDIKGNGLRVTEGNVGIGTTTPTEKLQVNGTVYASGLKLNANNPLYWGDPNTSITRLDNVLTLKEYTGQINLTGVAGLNVVLTHPVNGNASFSFPSNRLFALRHGAANILQSSWPTANECWVKLGATEAQYADANGARLYLTGGKGGALSGYNGGDVFIDGGERGGGNVDGNILIGTQFGKIGIGTTTPQSKLHVAGDAWVVNKLKIGDFTTGDVTDASIYTNGQVRASGGFNLRTPTSLDQIFSGMNFNGNGVGIWCNNAPTATFFTVGSGNYGADFTVGGYHNSGPGVSGLVSTINVSPNVLANGNSIEYRMINIVPQINSFNGSTGKISGIYIAPQNNTQVPFNAIETTGGSVLFNGGKVGIGTTNPQSDFHTTGTVRFAGLTNDNAKDRVIVSDANGNLAYRDASTLGGSSTAGWSLTGNNDANAKLGTIGSNDLPIITGNVEQMRIGANGNVGIGTTAISNYRLSVEGTIRTRKIRVDAGTWADYVFESDYKLRPLKEVEQYIQQNKHLPEVPSAADVKKEGLDVGDNQAVLLKKIEELTLYVIEQSKKNEEQQQLILQLQKEVMILKKEAKK